MRSPVSATQIKRTGWKVLAGAGVAATAAIGVALSGVASASTVAATGAAPAARTSAWTAAAARAALPEVTDVLVGRGRMGHMSWKVVLEYYRHLPRGYHVPTMPPGVPAPTYTGLLCERTYLGGVRVDHKGGPWSDCTGVNSPTQPIGTDEGLFGLTAKGTSGYRLFVGQTSAPVGYAVLTFTDGRSYRANSAHLRGTGFDGYAIPISTGRYIRSVDTFTTDGHRLSHETYWH